MNEAYRHQRLLNLLEEHSVLSTADFVQYLGVSPATIRRDINKLHATGKLLKVRKGAEKLVSHHTVTTTNTINRFDEKSRIAEAASRLCQNGETVLITCGSTMQMLGEQLCGKNVQIITGYIPLVNYLINNEHQDLVIIGGQYNKDKQITLSLNHQQELQYAANIMFSSGKGFTEKGLFKTDMIIATSEQQLSSKANKYVVLLDSSKLGKEVGMLFQELDNIDILITGKEADPDLINKLKNKGLEIILA